MSPGSSNKDEAALGIEITPGWKAIRRDRPDPFCQNWFGAQKAATAETSAIKTLFGIKVHESTGK
jgi:hypothetical protein